MYRLLYKSQNMDREIFEQRCVFQRAKSPSRDRELQRQGICMFVTRQSHRSKLESARRHILERKANDLTHMTHTGTPPVHSWGIGSDSNTVPNRIAEVGIGELGGCSIGFPCNLPPGIRQHREKRIENRLPCTRGLPVKLRGKLSSARM